MTKVIVTYKDGRIEELEDVFPTRDEDDMIAMVDVDFDVVSDPVHKGQLQRITVEFD